MSERENKIIAQFTEQRISIWEKNISSAFLPCPFYLVLHKESKE